MYKLPATPEKNTLRQDFLPSLGTKGLQVRIIPKREGEFPLEQVQVDALRTELEDQNWLDTLMALMRVVGNGCTTKCTFPKNGKRTTAHLGPIRAFSNRQ